MVKTLKEKIEVMQAAEGGKVIQSRLQVFNDKWANNDAPLWNWALTDYRIKPEPKVIYVNEFNEGGRDTFTTKQEALECNYGGVPKAWAVKYIEVIEE